MYQSGITLQKWFAFFCFYVIVFVCIYSIKHPGKTVFNPSHPVLHELKRSKSGPTPVYQFDHKAHTAHTHTHIPRIYIDRHMYIYYVVHALVMLHYVIYDCLLSILDYILYQIMIISEKSSGMHFIRFPKQLLRKSQCCVCVISFHVLHPRVPMKFG